MIRVRLTLADVGSVTHEFEKLKDAAACAAMLAMSVGADMKKWVSKEWMLSKTVTARGLEDSLKRWAIKVEKVL